MDKDVGEFQVSVGDPLLEGEIQTRTNIMHDLQSMNCLERPSDLEDLPEGLALDEFHDQIRSTRIVDDVVNGNDVRMTQFQAHASFAQELLDLDDLVAVPTAQDLDRNDFARLAMHGPENSGKRSGTDQVKDLVGPVEVPEPLSGEHPFQLKVGDDSFAKQMRFDLFEGDLLCTQFPPQAIDLSRRGELKIDAALGQGSGRKLHGSIGSL